MEQNIRGPIPDVLALELTPGKREAADKVSENGHAGLAVAVAPPRAHLVQRTEAEIYAAKANHITLRHRHGEVVAVVEIVSPGNKGSRAEFRAFVKNSAELIRQKIHLLAIDLFPPGKRDPQGIHKAIWDEFDEVDQQLPPGKPLAVASYDAGGRTAYVNFVAVGDVLPEAPLFFEPDRYVTAPLEQSYQTAWGHFSKELKGLLEGP